MEKSIKSILMPSREIVLESGVTAVVYPAGLVQIQEFSEHFATIASLLSTVVPKDEAGDAKTKKDARTAAIMGRILPYVITHGLTLVSRCVKLDLEDAKFEDLPHWDVAIIAEAWIDLTIGDGGKKLDPWVRLAKQIGAKMEMISPSPTSSSSSSPAVTQ